MPSLNTYFQNWRSPAEDIDYGGNRLLASIIFLYGAGLYLTSWCRQDLNN